MKKNILINDGISSAGEKKLIDYKFNIFNQHIEQEKLINFINENNISVILVRSATKVRKNIIDSCKSLKIIGRGGAGMDNIDVEYAQKKGIHVHPEHIESKETEQKKCVDKINKKKDEKNYNFNYIIINY